MRSHAYSQLALILVLLSSQAMTVAQQPGLSASTPLAALSVKDLFKRADAAYAADRLQEAREAIMVGLAKRKKPDKKYTPLLETINASLADREAYSGEVACNNLDLLGCQQKVAAAKAFANTRRVGDLDVTFTRLLSDLQQRYAAALKESEAGRHDAALVQLRPLVRFASHLPDVNANIERVTRLFIDQLLTQGTQLVATQRFDEAQRALQQVLELDKENERAKSALQTLDRGRQGYQAYREAQARGSQKNYRGAFRLIQSALSIYPEAKEFAQARDLIRQEWVNDLVTDVPRLLANAGDFSSTREAYLRLEQIRQLDPNNPEVPSYLPTASENFGANLLQRASELERVLDYSRIATAYIMKLKAEELMPPGTVKSEELRSVAAIFNRKRASQIVLAVENLSAASPTFADTVEVRARNTIDNLELPDLRVRAPDDYQRTLNEDPQFQDLRPNGYSSTALLTIGITKYESERRTSEKPTEKTSQYVSGTEMVPNPEYDKVEAELNRIRRALDSPLRKKDKPTPEGWTESTYRVKEIEVARIDRQIPRDKLTDYTYQLIEYKQHTTVEAQVTLRDWFTRQAITSVALPFHNERSAVEIYGVRDRDINGLQNQPVRMPSTDQVLREAERYVLEGLEKQLRELLPKYTARFSGEAEKALKADRYEDAAEAYICHWAFYRGRLDPGQVERVNEIVFAETGFDLAKDGAKALPMLVPAIRP